MILKFKVLDFVDETHPAYHDREGDSPWRLNIVDLPTIGTLLFNGSPMTANATMNIADAVRLEYHSDVAITTAHVDTFTFRIADTGSKTYSNLGTITINISKQDVAPTVDDNFASLTDKTYTFKVADFTNNFTDGDGDSYLELTIKSLPAIGVIKLNGGVISTDKVLNVAGASNLKYHLPDDVIIEGGSIYQFPDKVSTIILEHEAAGYILESSQGGLLTFSKVGQPHMTKAVQGDLMTNQTLCFDFQVSDNSVKKLLSNVAEFCLIPTGDIGAVTPYINQPPTATNFTIELPYNGQYTFSTQNFLDVYTDIEGDAPDKIELVSSPTIGINSGVAVNTPTAIEDITVLQYQADGTNTVGYSTAFSFKISDKGSLQYSNIGTVNIVVAAKLAEAPTVADNSAPLTSDTYVFSTASFTKNFTDGDLDSYSDVTIKSLPKALRLNLLGNPVAVGDVFEAVNSSTLRFNLAPKYAIYGGVAYEFSKSLVDIKAQYEALGYKLTDNTNGKLTFTDLENPVDPTYVQGTVVNPAALEFTFTTKDDSMLKLESNVAKFTLIPQGDVNVLPLYVNHPPTIGDNTLTTHYNKPITFTKANFTDETHPIYSDPEGDAPWRLLVATLPQYGKLWLDGVEVVAGQVITFEDIEAGKFGYFPDSSRIDINNDPFKFSVADVGSKQFAAWQ